MPSGSLVASAGPFRAEGVSTGLPRLSRRSRSRYRRCQSWSAPAADRWARWRVVACCYRRASTAPISTWRSRIDAVPDTVLGTHAGTVSRQSWRSSTGRSRFRSCRRGISSAVSVRRLPRPGADLQLLRPRPDLLRRRLCPACPPPRRPGLTPGRRYQDRPSRATACPCRADTAATGSAQKCHASRFTPVAAG